MSTFERNALIAAVVGFFVALIASGCGGPITYFVPASSSCFPDADEGVRMSPAHEVVRKCRRVAP